MLRDEYDAQDARYEDDVRRFYAHGDGRPRARGGKGHRYRYCEHGANLWVDHDIPCGRCEAGWDSNVRENLELAAATARSVMRDTHARLAAVRDLTDMGAPFDADDRKRLMEWAMEQVPWERLTAWRDARYMRAKGFTRQFHATAPRTVLPEPTFEDREAQAHYDDTWS